MYSMTRRGEKGERRMPREKKKEEKKEEKNGGKKIGRAQSLTTYGLTISLCGQSAPKFCFAFSFSIIPTNVEHSSV